MDQSYSESDVSLSPSKIFERLQMLRQLQIMQRGKLQKHRLQYQDSPESSSVTEIVSHFSNSTSYNTFRSLLQSSQATDQNSCLDGDISTRKHVQDYIEGVSVLNLSQESEFITNSPVSSRSVVSTQTRSGPVTDKSDNSVPNGQNKLSVVKKQISLDEMPILSPRKDFEELIIEKLKTDKSTKSQVPKIQQNLSKTKKPFLKRGEGMMRFGIRKNDLVIQNTKALPWRKSCKTVKEQTTKKDVKNPVVNTNKINKQVDVQIVVTKPKEMSPPREKEPKNINTQPQEVDEPIQEQSKHSCNQTTSSNSSEVNNNKVLSNSKGSINKPTFNAQSTSKATHPLKATRGQTWASVLTKEQDNFLRQLKQTEYYKNFISPAKSSVSDTSCNETLSKLRQDREAAEQNMFELLENKVTHQSFSLDNSFFNRFLKKNNLECSGESTPLVFQRCLYDNPDLLHLHPEGPNRKRNDNSCSDAETCSDYTECSESCVSVSTCCSCKGNETSHVNESQRLHNKRGGGQNVKNKSVEVMEEKKLKQNEKCPDDNVKCSDVNTAEMAEMNAKLIATSELLKDRLRELEDEIETFRKENGNLTKMREELDVERQKFYEEKTSFEQKYNEEKILSEYYLAEEKEKLNKQKQVYDRYVREMRGRLSKKDKDEVISLKKEISDLKEEIRDKDAKSTTITARLRNQLKMMEKEKKSLQEEVEKLKKENRRIQHSNDITRRLTNLKYLEQINKKLAHISSKEVHSEADLDSNVKYKAFEIERQSRSKKIQPLSNTRRRAKSVPNLNVTSRYAKYFSQKDSVSDKDNNKFKHVEATVDSDSEDMNLQKEDDNESLNGSDLSNENVSEDENNLEKIYNERFQSVPTVNRTTGNQETSKISPRHYDGFFIQKSNSVTSSKSLSKISLSPYQANSSESSVNTSKSPVSILSHRSHHSSKSPLNLGKDAEENVVNNNDNPYGNDRVKSPISILSNRSSTSQRSVTGLNKELYCDKRMIPSPEPSSSRSSISKTKLNPTEIRKLDGSRELRFPNGNVKHISADGKYTKFIYYNGDVKENFYDEGRIKYYYAETKTYHTTHPDGLEVLEFSDGQVEKRYKDGSSEIRLPNGSVRYYDPKNEHVREEWRFPDGAVLTVSADGEQRIAFSNGQVEVHAKDRKYREFPDGTVKIVYNDGTSETRYASGRVRIKNANGDLLLDKIGS
ncbi:uncharacterized protein [Epargyreus clarus]|uniref:uncharacterized protein n=1 Tax=Epargyreus clarus TaxID=520877 RepID=UPI003C2C9D43